MPARANAFYSSLTKLDYQKGHVYHTTTKARITQAKFFLDVLTEETRLEVPEYLDEFDKRDMLLFGLVNSLRSSLDSFAHEIILYYGGCVTKDEMIQFLNLLNKKTTTPLPPALRSWIRRFKRGRAFGYLNKLRNAQQHRRYPLMKTQAVALASLTIVGQDSKGGPAGWGSDEGSAWKEIEPTPVTASRPEPDLRLPDDPNVESGDETYSPGRPVFGVMRHLYGEAREFILASYALAI